MKINNTPNLLHLMEILKGDNDSGQKKKEQPSGSRQNTLLNLLSRLEGNLRRDIIRTWVNYQLPLELKQLKQLLSFLDNTGGRRAYPRIQAFAFLLKNKLPLLPALIDGLASNLDLSRTAAGELNNNPEIKNSLLDLIRLSYNPDTGRPKAHGSTAPEANTTADLSNSNPEQAAANSSTGADPETNSGGGLRAELNPDAANRGPQAGSPLLRTLAGKLLINSGLPTEELARVLAQYPAALREVLTALNQESGRDFSGLENRLLAQQLLNTRTDGLLLNLELPLFLPTEQEIVPAYLQVWKKERGEDEGGGGSKQSPEYKICFFITLPSRGTIRADLLYSPGRLQTSFQGSSPRTVELIKEELPGLQQRLAGLGLVLEEVSVGLLEKNEADLEKELLQPLLGASEEELINGFTHFDLRI